MLTIEIKHDPRIRYILWYILWTTIKCISHKYRGPAYKVWNNYGKAWMEEYYTDGVLNHREYYDSNRK